MSRAPKNDGSGADNRGESRKTMAVLLAGIAIGLGGCVESPGGDADPTGQEIGNAVTGAEDRAGRNQAAPGPR